MFQVFGGFFVIAVIGWILTSLALIGSKRRDDIPLFWYRSDVRGLGTLIAVVAIVGASIVGSWWYGPLILLVTPTVAGAIVMLLTPRPKRPF